VGKRDEREELLLTIKGRFSAKEMENQQNKKKQRKKKNMEIRGESRPNSFEVRVFIIYVFFLVYNLSIGTI